jgi:hypothetical protein
MKLFHKIKQWFKRSHHDAATVAELKDIAKYETEASLEVLPVIPAPKPKSNRKPGPKKQVPGQPAVKTGAPKKTGSTSKKPRQYNKPKPKV